PCRSVLSSRGGFAPLGITSLLLLFRIATSSLLNHFRRQNGSVRRPLGSKVPAKGTKVPAARRRPGDLLVALLAPPLGQPRRIRGRLGTPAHTELHEDVRHVVLHRLLGQVH